LKEQPIDIILLTHNRLDQTMRCLDALYEYTNIPFKITVIDDSTDGLTPTFFRRFAKEKGNVNYMRPGKVTCGNQAINIGVRNTRSEIVVFITQSTFVEPQWLFIALRTMREEPKAAIAGFKLLYPHGTILEAGLIVDSPMAGVRNPGQHAPGVRYTYLKKVDAVGFAVVLFRREAIVDGLDEETYIGFRGTDDVDACLTLREKGWEIIYCGLGVAYHELGASVGGGTEEGFKQSIENSQRFIAKWTGRVPASTSV